MSGPVTGLDVSSTYHIFVSSAGNGKRPLMNEHDISFSVYPAIRVNNMVTHTVLSQRLFPTHVTSLKWFPSVVRDLHSISTRRILFFAASVRREIRRHSRGILGWCDTIFDASLGFETDGHGEEVRPRPTHDASPQTAHESSDVHRSRSETSMDRHGGRWSSCECNVPIWICLLFLFCRALMEPCSSSTLHRRV